MTAKSDEFDPRFDPAFQRGFEGERPRSVAPRPVAEPPRASTAHAPEPAGAGPGGTVAADASSSPIRSTDATDEADEPHRANPFLIALAVVAVALVASGVWAVQAARAPFEGTNAAANVDFIGLQILQALAPASISLGVATAIGIVFVYALDWQRRH